MTVTPNAFLNHGSMHEDKVLDQVVRRWRAVRDAGWAVDSFSLLRPADVKPFVEVHADVAVRGTDGYLLRLAYTLHLVGRADTPVNEIK